MPSTAQRHPTLFQTYAERSEQPNLTPLATYLLRLIHLKRTNLCVSADVTSTSELLKVAEEVGDHICVLKTHADIIDDFGDKTIRGLNDIARRKKFLVFEDRKFGDIGNTVQHQYVGGPLAIVKWAPIVNCHIFPGAAIITALAQAAAKAIAQHNSSVSTDISASPAASNFDNDDVEEEEPQGMEEEEEEEEEQRREEESESEEEEPQDDRKSRKQSVVSVSTTISTKTETLSPQPHLKPSISRGSTDDSDGEENAEDLARQLEELGPPPFFRSLLLLAQMSSAGNFFTPEYSLACQKHARENKDFVMGFIAQESLNTEPDDNFITMTPGVQLAAGGDGLGQQYNTPRRVIGECGTDIIIVGRGILAAHDRRRAALDYRRQGWTAYEERLGSGRKP
ncbi:Orotidine 5'-phosphate decarboxylase [Acrodontium crateriforme]|uniref:Orotidine 5'-phosphate decarboxylase n=1 Tax=Acrodontium crateriforme TaxID=150365 RepID=A0AAQ3M7K2_9PEZI|nr:Orotidine 5'-phosphate decarboxylase [Acrodontium crateriforme]